MRFAIVLALIACGGAPVAKSSRTPELADLGWLVGSWHGDAFDERFAMASGTLWGVAASDVGFEVFELRSRDGRIELFVLENGDRPLPLPLVSSEPNHVVFGASVRVAWVRTGDTLNGDYARGDSIGKYFAVAKVADARAPELEAADLAFAADSAKRGADAWVDAMAPDGALWRKSGRVEGGDAIRADAAGTLAAGSLAWRPIASGARSDWGYTVGTYSFVPAGATAQAQIGSYCTIWHRIAGAWRVAFDLGA